LLYGAGDRFESQFLLDRNAPDEGVLVATIWFTAKHVANIAKRSQYAWKPVYFIQDDETRFKKPDGKPYAEESRVIESYDLIRDRVSNSKWVHDVLADRGVDSQLIPIGVDPRVFYPGKKFKDFTVIAMCRHTTPRRGYDVLVATYRALKKRIPGVRLLVYGQKPRPAEQLLMEHVGQLPQDELAKFIRQSHVVLEPSAFQGFGMPGLEAMASGTALVSTRNGGIDTYGKYGYNCLITQHLSEAVYELYKNEELRKLLEMNGLETVSENFTWGEIAKRWDRWLMEIL
jgi:glycosyltransferase involved in cell wall biosynthesis